MRTDVSILGGLIVTISFSVAPPEPDNGIPCAYIDEWEFVAINGRPKKNYDWLFNRISEQDENVILAQCLIAYSERF